VTDRRKRIRSSRRRIGGIGAAVAMDVVYALGHRVIGLELFVGDRPGRRDSAVMAEFTEILPAQAKKRSAENLGRAANEVVRARLKWLAGGVVPDVLGDVAVPGVDLDRIPVLLFARQKVAALEQQDALARGRKMIGERAAASSGADDDYVVMKTLASNLRQRAVVATKDASAARRMTELCAEHPTRSAQPNIRLAPPIASRAAAR